MMHATTWNGRPKGLALIEIRTRQWLVRWGPWHIFLRFMNERDRDAALRDIRDNSKKPVDSAFEMRAGEDWPD